MTDSTLSEDERRLLEERMPWYVNGTLGEAERDWVEQVLARTPAAARILEREKALEQAVPGLLAPAAQDIGLARLRQRVRAAQAVAPPASGWRRGWDAVQAWLARPALATAMAVALFAQGGVIGWLMSSPIATHEYRSASVAEVRTLRVVFKPAASVAQIRAALVGASARIVGGPTQTGEYWVASDALSLDEIRALLLQADVTLSIEVDPAGPRGQ